MIFNRITERVLIDRLQSEVDYLRDQNKLLLDRILALVDKAKFEAVKKVEHAENMHKMDLERIMRQSPEERMAEKEEKKKELEANKILNVQLAQMRGG